MAWEAPEFCTWARSQLLCVEQREFISEINYLISTGPAERGHNISSAYNMLFHNTSIPIVNTNRVFSVRYSSSRPAPTVSPGVAVEQLDGSFILYDCVERIDTPTTYLLNVSDICTIEKSTLYYIDQRYGVCLYKYQKDSLSMSVTSDSVAAFKTTQGVFISHQALIKTSDYIAERVIEWRCVIDGVMQVLTHEVINLEPFGPRNSGVAADTGFAAGWVPDPEIRKILVFPQPPSLAIPLTPEVVRLGFYDYGNEPGEESQLNKDDGGYKDMFYPAWCRSLQVDPFWRAAADKRYAVQWYGQPLIPTAEFIPPAPATAFIPAGNFVRHPTVGDFYQWILQLENGTTEIVTSPSTLPDVVDAALPDGQATHDKTLFLPFSLL